MKQRLRPQRSVSLLHGIMRMAMIRRNRVMAVCTPLTLVLRSRLMSLIITFMFEPAKLQMNCANASGARIRRDTGALVGVEPCRVIVDLPGPTYPGSPNQSTLNV